ncbi:hypothetical protein B0T19DRAFT_224085 [Cercophora scortea]|uniref:Meiotically up-regulated gene 154 protein n=1 Tax=Cercophora scortea TaxID=314031 RepID=A0AAE0IFF0_9PEZI|nr:hypothetical protein B0T19DRAFT_224085 [Cercophora scortea]
MPPRPQRLVRQRSLREKISSLLNPGDLWLYLSEEIQTLDWDSPNFGTRFGLVANFLFLLARANTGARKDVDDVFSDVEASGFFSFVVNFLVWTLVPISLLNAFYAMTRTRQYRLFEASVENGGPSTPSAHRVRVDSTPTGSTPLRVIQNLLASESAESRAHPDRTRDVWEMAVWDPYPATLRMFCLFSPGHILVYMLFLPLTSLDPAPSVTVFKCLVIQALLSTQLLLLQGKFTQQAKDTAIVQREVMHEYDVKFVHPRVHPECRDVAIQVGGRTEDELLVGTPSTVTRRGFQTHPNPNYIKLVDPDAVVPHTRSTRSPGIFTPSARPSTPEANKTTPATNRPSGLRQSLPMTSSGFINLAPPSTTTASAGTSMDTNTSGPGYGGSMGVYSHLHSPLKKAPSMGSINSSFSPRNSREMAAMEQRAMADRMVRQSSPLKESRRATTSEAEFLHSPSTLANARANRWTQERFPSRRL